MRFPSKCLNNNAASIKMSEQKSWFEIKMLGHHVWRKDEMHMIPENGKEGNKNK